MGIFQSIYQKRGLKRKYARILEKARTIFHESGEIELRDLN